MFAQATPTADATSRLLEYGVLGIFAVLLLAALVFVARMAWKARTDHIDALMEVVPLLTAVTKLLETVSAKIEHGGLDFSIMLGEVRGLKESCAEMRDAVSEIKTSMAVVRGKVEGGR